MSKTILAQVDGFTPVIDAIVDDVGLMPAIVFGRVWRYCQMKDGKCKASINTISEGIGVSYRTTLRHIKTLCDAGYLLDATPDRRNSPHEYFDTGKVMVKVEMGAGLSESHTEVCQKVTPRSVIESDEDTSLREPSKKEKDSGATAPNPPRQLTPHQIFFGKLAELCQIDLDVITDESRGKLNRVTKKLLDSGKVVEQLDKFRAYWYAADWRGQKGQPPGPWDVVNEWGRAGAWYKNGGSNGAGQKRSRGRASNSLGPASQSRARSEDDGMRTTITGRDIYEMQIEGEFTDEELEGCFPDYPNWRQMRDKYAASIGAG